MGPKATCSIDDCANPVFSRGWCQRHYGRWRTHGDPLGGRATNHSITGITCYAEGGCGKPVLAKGLCRKHYARQRLTGIVDQTVRSMRDTKADLAFLVALAGTTGKGCVTWPGRRTRQGYGATTVMGETLAHRVACRLAHGEPPTGKPMALHRCGKGWEGCVAPWHLYWGDSAENTQDALRHGTKPIGEMVWSAKLCAEVIPLIRKDQRSDYEVSLDYGVSPRTINDARAGRTWKHIPWE